MPPTASASTTAMRKCFQVPARKSCSTEATAINAAVVGRADARQEPAISSAGVVMRNSSTANS